MMFLKQISDKDDLEKTQQNNLPSMQILKQCYKVNLRFRGRLNSCDFICVLIRFDSIISCSFMDMQGLHN